MLNGGEKTIACVQSEELAVLKSEFRAKNQTVERVKVINTVAIAKKGSYLLK